MKRRLPFLAGALMLASGCLLVVDFDPFEAQLGQPPASGEGGTAGEASVPIVLTPSRSVVRAPRGETRTVEIIADTKVAFELVPLNASDVKVVQEAKDDRITLTITGGLAEVDESLVVRAKAGSREGKVELRVLVGRPGALDVSFGEMGKRGVVAMMGGLSGIASQRRVLASVGRRPIIGSVDGTVYEISEDGQRERVFFKLAGPVQELQELVADDQVVVVTALGDSNSLLAVVPHDRADGGLVLPTVEVPLDLFAIARRDGVTWYTTTTFGDPTSDLRRTDVADASTSFELRDPSALLPTDGGFILLGTREDNRRILRIADGPPPFQDKVFAADVIPLRENAYNGEILGGAIATNGTILVAAVESRDAGEIVDERSVALHFYSHSGQRIAITEPPFVATRSEDVGLAADRHDRFVMAHTFFDDNSGRYSLAVSRMLSDASLDPTFQGDAGVLDGGVMVDSCTTQPQVTIDEDGMILILCPGEQSSTLYRRWP